MNMMAGQGTPGSAPDKGIRTIVVVGGGSAGWMSAAALRVATQCKQCRIILVESEEIGIVGVGEATLPTLKKFNRLLGIDENEFIRHTQATFKLAIQFVDWKRIGHSYFNPLGEQLFSSDGGNPGVLPTVYQYLLKLAVEGREPDLGEYALCTAAARNNRFDRPAKDRPGPSYSYAFQFDATLYAKYLREYAEKRGVERVEGKIVDVQLHAGNGFIDGVILQSGQRIEGDLFIDCSGFRALLAAQALKDPYEDWTHWLPCDRAWAVPCESVTPLLPYTRATAREAGWQWRIPLQHRTGNGYVFSSKFVSEEKAAETLLSHLDGRALAEPRLLKFVTGRRQHAWIKNCVTVGLSSGFVEPLESTSLHFIQEGILRLIELFPDRNFGPLLIQEYNSSMANGFDRIRDFIILHYHLTEREDTEFWRYCKYMSIPETLAYKIEIFRKHGHVSIVPGEGFGARPWLTAMYSQGVTPESYRPLIDGPGEQAIRAELEKARLAVRRALERMPQHEEFIAKNCSAMPAAV
ncbi:MAG TPA: tryptophan halogenase family protein [Rhizomicrobium sp.]|jgi:tryptophan halogenase|nr:tryptophan halogenase family protein [Rhizomicrobium sp.]